MNRLYHPLIFTSASLILLICLTSCGTIREIGSEDVTIAGPEATHVRLIDSSQKLNSYPIREANNRFRANFDTDGVLLFVMRAEGEEPDSTVLSSRLDAWALIANIWLFFPIGHTVDAANGSQYRLDRSVVWFQGETRADSVVISIYDITRNREVERPYRMGDAGIIFGMHLGIRPPFSQVPLLGNDAGLTAGYRVIDPLALLYHWGSTGVLEYARDLDIEMALERSAHTLDVRYSLPFSSPTNRLSGLYAVVNVGIATFWTDSVRSTRDSFQSIPQSAIDVTMPTLGLGMGYAAQGVFMEFRREHGLGDIPVRTQAGDMVDVTVANFVFRWGMNLEF